MRNDKKGVMSKKSNEQQETPPQKLTKDLFKINYSPEDAKKRLEVDTSALANNVQDAELGNRMNQALINEQKEKSKLIT